MKVQYITLLLSLISPSVFANSMQTDYQNTVLSYNNYQQIKTTQKICYDNFTQKTQAYIDESIKTQPREIILSTIHDNEKQAEACVDKYDNSLDDFNQKFIKLVTDHEKSELKDYQNQENSFAHKVSLYSIDKTPDYLKNVMGEVKTYPKNGLYVQVVDYVSAMSIMRKLYAPGFFSSKEIDYARQVRVKEIEFNRQILIKMPEKSFLDN